MDEDFEDLSLEHFNISDIRWDVKNFRRGKEVHLIARSDSNINLMRYYLALKNYIEKMEHEIGIMEEFGEIN
jgi:hypothetical protein